MATTTSTQASPISINAIAQLPLKLTSANFSSWCAQFDALLTSFELMGYVDGSISSPPKQIMKDGQQVANPYYNHWLRQDKLILYAIFASTSEYVLPFVASSKTSCEAWQKLTKLYANRTRSQVMDLKNTPTCTRRDDRPVSEYLQHMKHIADEISLTGATLDEDDLVLHTLNGLGTEYREISAAIHARENSIPFEELYDKLIAFELHLKQEAAQSDINIPTANFANKFQGHHTGRNSWSKHRPFNSNRANGNKKPYFGNSVASPST